MNSIALGLLAYVVVMLLIGLYTYRYMHTIEDFLLGGRRLGAWVIAFSERASGESAWFLLGLPGFAYAMGMSVFWTVIGVALGIFISWTVIAKRLRWETERYGALTIPDYLEARFQGSRAIRIVSTVIILLFYLFYLGAQIIGAGKILNATFGIEHGWGMVLGAGVVALYTMAGGFTAVALTDLIQGVIMLFAAVFLPVLGILHLGGIGEVFSRLQEMDPNFLSVLGGKSGRDLLVGVILGGMGVGLGYMGQPHLLTRYMAIRSTREVRKGVLIAMLWVLLAYWGAPFIGIVGKAYFGPELADAEKVMPMLAMAILPPFLAGFVIAGAIAAMMSTADSQLLVVTSAIVEDIYRKLLGRNLSQRALVVFSRWTTLGVTALALLLAFFAKNLIYWLVLYAWSGLGASFGPPLLLALLWKGTTRWGALAGMLTGTLTTILWYNVPLLKATVYELIPAFLLSLLVTYLVSLLTAKR
ncbi:MAG: sodium/proline symporter [Thermotogae bacterium]|nr:sodium/proline symporter [Thermotogota bacterium]